MRNIAKNIAIAALIVVYFVIILAIGALDAVRRLFDKPSLLQRWTKCW